MGKIIAFANQKGGVGKTTTAINLAAALSERGKRVLLCDFDPQGNATSGFGVDPRSLETSIYDLIVSEEPDTKTGIVHTKWVDLIGANVNLAGADQVIDDACHAQTVFAGGKAEIDFAPSTSFLA